MGVCTAHPANTTEKLSSCLLLSHSSPLFSSALLCSLLFSAMQTEKSSKGCLLQVLDFKAPAFWAAKWTVVGVFLFFSNTGTTVDESKAFRYHGREEGNREKGGLSGPYRGSGALSRSQALEAEESHSLLTPLSHSLTFYVRRLTPVLRG